MSNREQESVKAGIAKDGTGKIGPVPARLADELIDAFFDRELDEGSREHVFNAALKDREQCERVVRTQRLITLLREPVSAPDVAPAVLDRLEGGRGFMSAGWRRWVKAGRAAVGVGALGVVLAVALVQRWAPDLDSLNDTPRPVAAVVETGTRHAAAGVESVAGAIGQMTMRLAQPVMQLTVSMASPEDRPAPPAAQSRLYIMRSLTPSQTLSIRRLGQGSGSSMLVMSGSAGVTPTNDGGPGAASASWWPPMAMDAAPAGADVVWCFDPSPRGKFGAGADGFATDGLAKEGSNGPFAGAPAAGIMNDDTLTFIDVTAQYGMWIGSVEGLARYSRASH